MARSAMLWFPLTFFAALTTFVSADVQFTSPAAGAQLAGGTALVIEWKDSGATPAIADLTTYDLFLCAGGNDQNSIYVVKQITAVAGTTFAVTGNKASGTVELGLGDSTKNAYFLKIISVAKTGGTITNFSPRFSLSGMTGAFPDNVVQALKTVTGTDGPAKIDQTSPNANANPNPAAGDFGVQYTMQTGPTRYAPMQPIPPTKITKKNQTPLFPTSSVAIAKSMLPLPKQQTTITQSQTFSVSSRENTVAAAAMPSDDMAKFLARWKD